jgi:hypothetical protein
VKGEGLRFKKEGKGGRKMGEPKEKREGKGTIEEVDLGVAGKGRKRIRG